MNPPPKVSWMQEALNLARQAGALDEVPVGAVIILEGKIIGRGHNLREKNQDPLAHAEMIAIKDAAQSLGSWRLENCEMYVTLEPCPMCLAASQQSRLKRVIYGARDPKGGAICLGYHLHQDKKTHHRFEVECQEVAECSEILSAFFKAKRTKGQL